MAIERMDHVGVVVADIEAAVEFFVALGLEKGGGGHVGGEIVDRIVGLDGVDCDFAFVRTPDGNSSLELIQFRSPPAGGDASAPANHLGLRHLCFAVDDIRAALDHVRPHGGELLGEVVDYEGQFLLCYLRGPEGIIIELAEKLSPSGP